MSNTHKHLFSTSIPSLTFTIANLPVGATNVACDAIANNTYIITAAYVTAGNRANTATADANNVG